jgi:hypothetical protein
MPSGADGGAKRGDGSGLAESYETAQRVQERIAETYRDIRAAQLARAAGISEEEAKRRTDTIRYQSTPLALGKGASLATERAAQGELAAMVARSERLLDQAQGRPGSGASGLLARLRQAANQGDGQARDVTPFMAKDEADDQSYRPVPAGEARGAGAPPAVPPGLVNNARFGRRVAASGAPGADWMFVDTWHTIGPFPNPGRTAINTPYPPEASVDLDARYPGKDGRELRWTFVQASTPDVVPANAEEYGIYYAYTEIWMDEARDLWVAVGSDDKSTLWVEDQLVWMSGDHLKGWQIGEGIPAQPLPLLTPDF